MLESIQSELNNIQCFHHIVNVKDLCLVCFQCFSTLLTIILQGMCFLLVVLWALHSHSLQKSFLALFTNLEGLIVISLK